MTGTFDNWSKSEQMEKVGDKFEKSVELPDTSERIYYKVGTHKSVSFRCVSFLYACNLAHISHRFIGWRRRETGFSDTPRRAHNEWFCACARMRSYLCSCQHCIDCTAFAMRCDAM